ncbi:MAG: hypothetical protein WAT71_04100 [Ignavibacteria bacterium]
MKKFLKCFVSLFLFTVLINSSANAQLYRSVASGNWNANSTWEYSSNNGVSWSPAITTPTIANNSGTSVSHIVTITADITFSQLTFFNSGSLSINAGIVFTYESNLTLATGSSIIGDGTFKMKGADLIIHPTSLFSATLKINSIQTWVRSTTFTSIVKLASVIVDSGSILYTGNSVGYDLLIYGNLTCNGSINGFGFLKLFGPSLVNSGSITTYQFSIDSTCTISGSGSYTSTEIFIGPNGNVSLANDITFSPITFFEIQTGGIFSANTFNFTFNAGRFAVRSGGTVVNSGTVRTLNNVTIDPRLGSSFNADLNVVSGTTIVTETVGPIFKARLNGNVTINSGATLSSGNSSLYTISVYGNLTNNGSIIGNGSNLKLFGPSLVNSGSIAAYQFSIDSTCTISGSGSYTSTEIYIGSNGNVSLANDVTFSPAFLFEIQTGGIFSANTRIFTFNAGRFAVRNGGTVVNSGTVRTQNIVTIDPRVGSSFNANLNVFSGTTTVTETLGPNFKARLNGNVTINSGATFYSGNSSLYTVSIYGNLTNNGTMTGAGSSVRFFGAILANSGSIASSVFTFDSTCTISGNGTYTSENIYLSSTGNVTLLNNVTFTPTGTGPFFEIKSGGIFSANTFIFIFNSGRFAVRTGGTVVNSGIVRTQNNVTVDPRTGSSFNADLNVFSGTTTVTETASPYTARLNGNITINSGATLYSGNSSLYNLQIFGNILNNGIITGFGYVNFLSGAHTLSGTGSITSNTSLLSGADVTMTSNHQMSNVNINSGAMFNISNFKLKLTASNPIAQNGTFIAGNSKVEYNGTALQTVSTANINYHGLIINNNAGAILTGNTIIPDTLNLNLGDLNLNGNNITFTPDGYLKETPGNLVFGTTGFLVTTRTLGAPSSLNVAGFGAVLTTGTSLGSTELKRGHTVQNGLNGGTSIKRYYDITPTTNSGLNATLVYKYDDTELDGTPEPSMKLFRSTNSGGTWFLQGGLVNTISNQITLTGIDSFSRWSSDSSAVSVTVKLAFEAFYNAGLNRMNFSDTVRGYLRNSVSPYAVVDSAKEIVNLTTMKVGLQFNIAPIGTYYLQLKHRNAIETWTATGLSYNPGTTLNHDFTSAANKAFGSNQNQVDAAPLTFAFWSGDVNQDGTVDLTDGSQIDNDAANFATGYLSTDVNGDGIVDVADGVFADNNGLNFVGKVTP